MMKISRHASNNMRLYKIMADEEERLVLTS